MVIYCCAIKNEIPLPNVENSEHSPFGVHESYTVEVHKCKYQTNYTVNLLLEVLLFSM